MNVIPKIRIYRSLQQRDRQLAPRARGHPSSYAPGTPPALRGPLVRKPFSPLLRALRTRSLPSPPRQQFGMLGNRGWDASHPPHPPPAPGNTGLKRRSSPPCLALPCSPQRPLPGEAAGAIKHRSGKCSSGLRSLPLAPSLTGRSPSWWSGLRGWWLAGSPRSG